MSAIAEAPSRNGNGPKPDAVAYREAVKARMKKYEGSAGSRRKVAPSEAEVDQFLAECQAYQLDPLAGQIYASWEDGAMRAVTTVDGLRALAERTGRYDGQNDPEWCDKDGNWTDYWPGEEKPLAARVRVHKKGAKVPTTGTANWCDFAPTDVVEGSMWSTTGGKPAHMLSIRAEALALRKAFPAELSGLYTVEELGISLAAIGAGGAESSGDPAAAAVDVPSSPSAPMPVAPTPPAASTPPPSPAVEREGPAVIVDPAAEQPSGAPARPQAKRNLAEVLASSEYEKLRGELTEMLFDQLPDRLTDEQSESLGALLVEVEEAGITPVELGRFCKVALREGKGDVEARSQAFQEWIAERRGKADVGAEAGSTDAAHAASEVGEPEAQDLPEDPSATGPSQTPSLLDADEGGGGAQ